METLGLPFRDVIDPAAAVPIACTLDADTGRERAARWAAVASTGARTVVSTPERVTISYQALPGVVDELDRLVNLESHCCAFLQFEVAQDAGSVHVVVTRADATGGIQSVEDLSAIFVG